MKINGADPDFHRRDLFDAIGRRDFPEWEFSVQAFDQAIADGLPFDVLDPTKLIPEEIIPLQPIGRMVLDRNPTNFFAETEQIAFHPGHVPPGIDFSNDPLLQGRLFSYLDTQLSRLGGPNFHEIPINRPKCPMQNFQRDGISRMDVAPGRVAYEPNSLAPDSPRENPTAGFRTFAPADEGSDKRRVRAETFSDHYSQARLFWRSMSEPEQRHIVNAFSFELGKVETVAIRRRMLGHLSIVDKILCLSVEQALGMEGQAEKIHPARQPLDLDPSPALSIVLKAPRTLQGRTVAALVSRGSDRALVGALRTALEKEGARLAVVAPTIGGVAAKGGKRIDADHALAAAPSIFFDAVVVALSEEGADMLVTQAAAIDWVRDAFGHLKIIGVVKTAAPLLERAGVEPDAGVIPIEGAKGIARFINAAKGPRIWDREPTLRSPT